MSFTRDLILATIKTCIAIILIDYLTDLSHEATVEVALLLGAFTLFGSPRQIRTTRDIKQRIEAKKTKTESSISEETSIHETK